MRVSETPEADRVVSPKWRLLHATTEKIIAMAVVRLANLIVRVLLIIVVVSLEVMCALTKLYHAFCPRIMRSIPVV
jgi:hypothetical protein